MNNPVLVLLLSFFFFTSVVAHATEEQSSSASRGLLFTRALELKSTANSTGTAIEEHGKTVCDLSRGCPEGKICAKKEKFFKIQVDSIDKDFLGNGNPNFGDVCVKCIGGSKGFMGLGARPQKGCPDNRICYMNGVKAGYRYPGNECRRSQHLSKPN